MNTARKKVYIDGQAGTTGLQIHDRLKNRTDIELLEIDPEQRKDPQARRSLMEQADLVFLCLPDEAAREAVRLMEGLDARIIDASTAHRTSSGWTYGFPELSAAHKQAVARSKYVANPGCHASGFIALVYPLIHSGLLDPDTKLSAFSLTGYTGGGRSMIESYESDEKSRLLESPKPYALGLEHKHLPEMQAVCGLNQAPLFVPVVADFPQGMAVQLFLDPASLSRPVSLKMLEDLYSGWYPNPTIRVSSGSSSLYAAELEGSDGMKILVNGGKNGFVLSALFDNLGKGASGAAVQNMNLMLGLEEYEGLHLE